MPLNCELYKCFSVFVPTTQIDQDEWSRIFPFSILNQSVVPCLNLTVASWPAYRFLRRQVRWYSYLFKNFLQFVVIHTVKAFSIVNEAEVDVFLEFPCFFSDPMDAGNLIWFWYWLSGDICVYSCPLCGWKSFLCYDQYTLLAKLCWPLLCFVLHSKPKLAFYSRYILISYICISIPYDEKDIFFWC